MVLIPTPCQATEEAMAKMLKLNWQKGMMKISNAEKICQNIFSYDRFRTLEKET